MAHRMMPLLVHLVFGAGLRIILQNVRRVKNTKITTGK